MDAPRYRPDLLQAVAQNAWEHAPERMYDTRKWEDLGEPERSNWIWYVANTIRAYHEVRWKN